MPRRRKSINFDLDTESLRALFGENGRSNAYAQILRFFESHGFEHRQFSGYVSLDRLNYAETYVIIETLLEKHPWIGTCVKRFDVTDFMAESDAMEFIQEKAASIQVDGGIDDEDIF
jgi:virulence-associated protein VapD